VGTKRLSGDAACTATFGWQTRESRYVLLGEIAVGGRKLLVATTHLSAPPWVPDGFEAELERLVRDGVVLPAQRDEILETLERKRARNLAETRALLEQIDKQRGRLAAGSALPPVILGGDFNTEPRTPSIALIEESGFRSTATGPGFLTWDPLLNHENMAIGSKRSPPLPTFDIPEVERLLEPRRTTPRQIDFIFVSDDLAPRSAQRVLDRELDGMYLSDHFGMFVTVDLSGR
jgi:endonuclease/exonuclease/phosphatase family metal-dependent hydrolase